MRRPLKWKKEGEATGWVKIIDSYFDPCFFFKLPDCRGFNRFARFDSTTKAGIFSHAKASFLEPQEHLSR